MSKADRSASILFALANIKDHRLRELYVAMLDNIWPGFRCSYDCDLGLKVHYRSDRITFRHLPKTLVTAAGYIEEVHPDGSAQVMKSPDNRLGLLKHSTRALSELTGEMPRPPRSVWEILFDD